MKTNKTHKRKYSDFYEDSNPKTGSKGHGKMEKITKKRLSIYDDFEDEEDFVKKTSRRY